MAVHSESIEFKHIGESLNKKQIILCETKRNFRNYIYSLRYRYNGKNPYLPNYVISREGEVIEIIKPIYYSNFMSNEKINKNSIIICLENYGWLEKKPMDDLYLNWIGDIYKEEVFEKRWRDKIYWHPYNKQEQINSLVKLLFELCEEFKLPKNCAESNVFNPDAQKINGIVSKSSFDLKYKDLNPSFNFKLLEKLLENE